MWDGKEGSDFLGLHHIRMTSETRNGGTSKKIFQLVRKT